MRLKNLHQTLSRWNKLKYGHFDRKIEELQTKLREDYQPQLSDSLSPLTSLSYKQEMLWKQKAHDNNIQLGDRNTRFSRKVQRSRWRNRLNILQAVNGNIVSKPVEMAKLFLSPWSSVIKAGPVVNLNFFHELFTPVTTEENHMLTALPTEDEIYKIVSTLNPWKVPGQDGFNGKFYSSCWTIIRHEFFRGTLHRREINATLIIPIPNCASALFVHEFRPISLRNEIYKIISKPMVSHLKLVMQKCNSEEQAAFIQAKQIVDSVTLASVSK